MKKTIILIFGTLFFISGCGNSSDKEKLLEVYKEILIARNAEPDSLKANVAVMKVMKKNGYTEQQFRNEIFELARSEKDFMHLIDSLRNYVKDEQTRILDSANKKKAKKELEE